MFLANSDSSSNSEFASDKSSTDSSEELRSKNKVHKRRKTRHVQNYTYSDEEDEDDNSQNYRRTSTNYHSNIDLHRPNSYEEEDQLMTIFKQEVDEAALKQVKEVFPTVSERVLLSLFASFNGEADRVIEYLLTTPTLEEQTPAQTQPPKEKKQKKSAEVLQYIEFLKGVDASYFKDEDLRSCNTLEELEAMLEEYVTAKAMSEATAASSSQPQQAQVSEPNNTYEFTETTRSFTGNSLLLSLPKEVLQIILQYLPLHQIFWTVRNTCRLFRMMLHDSELSEHISPKTLHYTPTMIQLGKKYIEQIVGPLCSHLEKLDLSRMRVSHSRRYGFQEEAICKILEHSPNLKSFHLDKLKSLPIVETICKHNTKLEDINLYYCTSPKLLEQIFTNLPNLKKIQFLLYGRHTKEIICRYFGGETMHVEPGKLAVNSFRPKLDQLSIVCLSDISSDLPLILKGSQSSLKELLIFNQALGEEEFRARVPNEEPIILENLEQLICIGFSRENFDCPKLSRLLTVVTTTEEVVDFVSFMKKHPAVQEASIIALDMSPHDMQLMAPYLVKLKRLVLFIDNDGECTELLAPLFTASNQQNMSPNFQLHLKLLNNVQIDEAIDICGPYLYSIEPRSELFSNSRNSFERRSAFDELLDVYLKHRIFAFEADSVSGKTFRKIRKLVSPQQAATTSASNTSEEKGPLPTQAPGVIDKLAIVKANVDTVGYLYRYLLPYVHVDFLHLYFIERDLGNFKNVVSGIIEEYLVRSTTEEETTSESQPTIAVLDDEEELSRREIARILKEEEQASTESDDSDSESDNEESKTSIQFWVSQWKSFNLKHVKISSPHFDIIFMDILALLFPNVEQLHLVLIDDSAYSRSNRKDIAEKRRATTGVVEEEHIPQRFLESLRQFPRLRSLHLNIPTEDPAKFAKFVAEYSKTHLPQLRELKICSCDPDFDFSGVPFMQAMTKLNENLAVDFIHRTKGNARGEI